MSLWIIFNNFYPFLLFELDNLFPLIPSVLEAQSSFLRFIPFWFFFMPCSSSDDLCVFNQPPAPFYAFVLPFCVTLVLFCPRYLCFVFLMIFPLQTLFF